MVSEVVKNHCNSYKGCKGCPLVGQKCTAPASPHLYDEWLKSIELEIEKINEMKFSKSRTTTIVNINTTK